jgi:type I restriction enzyme S subunit
MVGKRTTEALRDLLLTTKDGDWGKESPEDGYVPYRVIRGTDFPSARIGDISSIPLRYLSEPTVHRRTLELDDILLETAGGSRDRPTGRSLLITRRLLSSLDLPATCASFARFLRVDPVKADPRYVYWHLQYLYASGEMEEHQVQHTGVARFQYTKFAETEQIPLPTLDEQRAIAHILGTLDDKIELNRRMNETLEAMARALFKSWFVDFDPVRAKAEGRDPGLPKQIADLFPDSFEDSELGEIPKGWRVGKVEEFATLSRDSINPGEFSDEVFDHFSIPAFDEGWRPKTALGAEIKSNKFIVPSNAVLVSKLNPRIPRVWLPVVRDNHRAVCSTEFLVTVPRPGISREFLFSFLSSDIFAGVFETLVTGTSGSHQRVKPDGLLAMDAVIPGEPVIRQFTNVVRPLVTRVNHARDKSDTLASLRNTLLPNLISGELRAPASMHHREMRT